jgi:hypothetical protein
MTAEAATLSYEMYMSPIASATTLVGASKTPMPNTNWRVSATASEYTPVNQDVEFGRHFSKLEAIRTDRTLWADGAQAPQDPAIYWAFQVLQKLEHDMLRPSRIVASAEGGVAICFVREDIYADIECFNDGVILGAISDRRDRPIVWEIEPGPSDIARAAARIRKFLCPPSSDEDDSR